MIAYFCFEADVILSKVLWDTSFGNLKDGFTFKSLEIEIHIFSKIRLNSAASSYFVAILNILRAVHILQCWLKSAGF
jgi:hypothetical protein